MHVRGRVADVLAGRLLHVAAIAAAYEGNVGARVAALIRVPLRGASTALRAGLPLAEVLPDGLVPVAVRPGQEHAVWHPVGRADLHLQG